MTWLLIAAIALRIAAAFAVQKYVDDAGRQFLIEGDANGYWHLAHTIAAGEEYSIYTPPRRVLRMPGFPLVLSTSICLFGDSILAARLLLAIVGVGCCWLTYLLGRRLFSRNVGFWAAAYVSLNPVHIGNSVLILSETWFAFWMLLSLVAFERFHRKLTAVAPHRPSSGSILLAAALTGCLIGLTVLVRPGFLPWLAFVAVGILLVRRPTPVGRMATKTELDSGQTGQRSSLGLRGLAFAAVVAGCVVVMSPWAVRNYQVTGHLVFTSLWSGPSLYDGLNPNADGTSDMRFFDEENVLADVSEFEMNQHYKKKAIDFVLSNPAKAAWLAIPKARQYLAPVPNSLNDKGWAIRAGCLTSWFFLFGCVGAAMLSRQWKWMDLLLTAGPFLLFLLVHMVFVGSVRYRLPIEFPLSVLAAMGWQQLGLKRRIRTSH